MSSVLGLANRYCRVKNCNFSQFKRTYINFNNNKFYKNSNAKYLSIVGAGLIAYALAKYQKENVVLAYHPKKMKVGSNTFFF